MVIIKEVKMYSNRKRINITNGDGLSPGEEVVLLPKKVYEEMVQEYQELKNRTQEPSQDLNLEETLQKILNPIYEHHEKELKRKDIIIQEKDTEIKRLQSQASKFNTRMNGLSLFDMVRHKHKKLISEYQDTIWIYKQSDSIAADIKSLPGKDTEDIGL